MAEFPEDICRLVNQYVPWDRHHRSPTAELVRSREFKSCWIDCIGEWRHQYIRLGAYYQGRPGLALADDMSWYRLHTMMNHEQERSAIKALEEHMLDWAEYSDLEDEQETETGEDDETDESG